MRISRRRVLLIISFTSLFYIKYAVRFFNLTLRYSILSTFTVRPKVQVNDVHWDIPLTIHGFLQYKMAKVFHKPPSENAYIPRLPVVTSLYI